MAEKANDLLTCIVSSNTNERGLISSAATASYQNHAVRAHAQLFWNIFARAANITCSLTVFQPLLKSSAQLFICLHFGSQSRAS